MDSLLRYQRLIENIPAVTWVTDRQGKTVFISPSVRQVFGYTAEEVQQASQEIWIEQIHPADKQDVLDAYHGLFAAGSPFDMVYRIRHKEGHWVWIHDRATATFREGGFEYAYGVFFDVTAQKETELALRDKEKRFEILVKNSSDWIWEFDENEIFTYSSPRIKNLLGYDADEVVGMSAFDLIPPDEAERVRAEFQQVKDARQPFSNLLNVNQHKDGRLVTIESSGVPIVDGDGVFRGYRGIDRDISEREKLEVQLRHMQKMEAIGTLAGGISHDFNNILSAMLGYAEMLKRDVAGNERGMRRLTEVLKAGERAKDLVRQILSFSRIGEQGKCPVQLMLLIEEVERFLRATMPSTIEIRKEIKTVEDVILADPTQIHQVIMNLSTNAAQAMSKKGGRLTFKLSSMKIESSADASLVPGKYVKLSVQDSGGGIDPEHLDRIFDPYFTTKSFGEGTGLGLSVVHGIVQGHGGKIMVQNNPGVGVCFEVLLPLLEGSALLVSEPASVPEPACGDRLILLVDDEESLAKLGKEMLEDIGYRVTIATDSAVALQLFEQDPGAFDLVITDQTMPNMTGEQLARKILQQNPEMPIILCSGLCSQLNREKMLAAGISKLLQKPVSLSLLSVVAKDLLEG